MASDPWIGTVIGDRYRLVARIGSGGMASVYRAEHSLLKKPVAVKLLLPELAADQDMAARFEHEAIAAARLDHPNCVATTDFGRTPGGQLFLVMEYLDGRSLSDIAGYGKRLPWEQAVEIGRQILRGLARAHEMGIVHRDLKPSNIMLISREGGRETAKIIDFGIAKIFDGTNMAPSVHTKAGIVFGTADFVAPERLLGKGDKDPRSDLYSVGVLVYEMVTGTRPFHADDPYEIVKRALAEAPRRPSGLVADLPAELDAAIMRALEKKPEDRFASAREFLGALDAVGRLSSAASPAPRKAPAGTPAAGDPAVADPASMAGETVPSGPPSNLVLENPFSESGAVGAAASGLPGAPAAASAKVPSLDAGRGSVGFAAWRARGAQVARSIEARQWRGRSVLVWAGLGLIPIAVAVFAIVYSASRGSGGGMTVPGIVGTLPGLAAPDSAPDPESDVARLVELAATGATVDVRQSAFDRLVALGYVDRVPWLAMLGRDLEQLPTCEQRRAVVAQLAKLKDPAARPVLEKARDRAGNECLVADCQKAIAALGGKAQPDSAAASSSTAEPAGSGQATKTSAKGTSTRRRRTTSGSSPKSSGTSGGGHF